MRGLWLILILAGLPALGSRDELSELLDRMEKSRESLRSLRARFALWEETKDKAKKEAPYARGTLSFRPPGDFSWSKSDNRGRAILTETEFLLHAPWGSKEDVDDRNVFGREHHGAEWFRGNPKGETPPLLPLLADHPWSSPVVFLADFAPRRFLSMLPRLKLGAKKKEGERSFQVLEFRPEGDDIKVRMAEQERSWDRQSLLFGEIWVDVSDASIARLRLGFIGHERRYSVLERRGGIATTILTEFERDQDNRPSSHRLELTDVEIGAEVADSEFRLRVPEGRLVRDWTTRPESHYQDRLKRDPKDAGAWLELAALNMERGEWATAEEAFRRVVDLRSDAPEGYLGLLGALQMNRDKGAGVEVLEKAVPLGWPLFHRAAAQRYEARGDQVSARRHYEAILSIGGQDVATLREMARVSRDGEERKALLLKALRIDLDRGDGSTAHAIRIHDLYPSDRDREELAALHLEAVRKDGARPWIHVSLMEMFSQLGRKEESRKHARAIVDLLVEGKPWLGRHDTLELLKIFTAAGEFESARRLHQAMAAHPDPHARASALEIEGELVAIQGDLESIVRHLDRALLPPENDRFKSPNPAAKPFLEALKRERKLDALVAKLLETPADSERGKFHTKVLSWAMEQMRGSDHTKLLIQVQERMNGRPADLNMHLSLLQSLAREKKWAEARTAAKTLLERSDLLTDGRAVAESAMAECHEAAGEVDLAVAACVRAVEASPSRAPWVRMIQARALLGVKRAGPAAETYIVALEERIPPREDTETWSPEKLILDELRKTLAGRRELLGEMETAAGKDPGRVGSPLILAVVEELRGRPRAAVDAFERAVALRPSGTLLRELLFSCVTAGRLDRAIEIRAKLAAVAFAKPPTGRSEPPFDIEALNKKLLEACTSTGDVGLCKRFARTLASEPLGRYGQERTLRDLLVEVLEEDFFEEIDATLVRNARTEWQRFHARFPLAWAYRELGMGERGAAIYERLLREQEWSESSRSVGVSWIESLREKTEALSIEVVRSWLAGRPFGKDEVDALADGWREHSGGRGLSRLCRFRARQRNPELPWLKLEALFGERLDERITCLEELLRRGETEPEWMLLLGVARLERGEEDRAVLVFRELFRATPEMRRPRVWDSLIRYLQGTACRSTDLTAAARVWARGAAAEARLEFGDDPAERQAASLELARAWNEANAPLRALIALARAGSDSDELRKLRVQVRSSLPKDILEALKAADFLKPTGPQEAEARGLIQDLESDAFSVRQNAHRHLVRIGESAIRALLPLMDSPNVDLQSHAREILRELVGE